MRESGAAPSVVIPYDDQEFGALVEVAPGILWSRIPLPYEPGHVNTFLIEDDDGWCAVDTGLLDEPTKSTWEKIIGNLPRRKIISRVIVTHWHPDHMGAAGWLCQRENAPLLIPEAEYLKGLAIEFVPRDLAGQIERAFFLSHGLPPDEVEAWVANGHRFIYMMAPLPRTFQRLVAGRNLEIGDRTFRIKTARGHSPEELMLQAGDGDVYFCADQLGPRIAPNLAVQPSHPLGNPLELYFECLDDITADRPGDSLLLPGHEQPFRGFSARADELRAYYKRRCERVALACAEGAKTADELLAHLFKRRPNPVWIGFLLCEAVTYANYLIGQGRLMRREERGIVRFEAV